jgi:hypothetical protein
MIFYESVQLTEYADNKNSMGRTKRLFLKYTKNCNKDKKQHSPTSVLKRGGGAMVVEVGEEEDKEEEVKYWQLMIMLLKLFAVSNTYEM